MLSCVFFNICYFFYHHFCFGCPLMVVLCRQCCIHAAKSHRSVETVGGGSAVIVSFDASGTIETFGMSHEIDHIGCENRCFFRVV